MKKIGVSILAGVAVAVGGMFTSDLSANLFNGMDYGSASVLGICMYLCVVVVTCTGIIISKIEGKSHSDEKENK